MARALTPAFFARSNSFARFCTQSVTSVSAGPPLGGLYLKPPSSGGLCDGVMTMPSAKCSLRPRLYDEDGAGDDRRWRYTVVFLNDRVNAIRRQHFECSALRRRRNGMRILPHVDRTVDGLPSTVIADCLRDRQNVRFIKGAMKRRSAVPAGPEAHQLIGVAYIGLRSKYSLFHARNIDQDFLGRGLACEWRNAGASRAVDSGCVSKVLGMVRPSKFRLCIRESCGRLENFPELAMFRIAFCAHAPGSRYSAPNRSCASTYDVRSARCI